MPIDFSRPGERVFAVRDANAKQVFLYGFGVYVGDFPRPGWDDGERQEYEAILADIEDPKKKEAALHRLSLNPKIELDGGSVVWGMQCWWGAESRWEEMVRGREVVTVNVPD